MKVACEICEIKEEGWATHKEHGALMPSPNSKCHYLRSSCDRNDVPTLGPKCWQIGGAPLAELT